MAGKGEREKLKGGGTVRHRLEPLQETRFPVCPYSASLAQEQYDLLREKLSQILSVHDGIFL